MIEVEDGDPILVRYAFENLLEHRSLRFVQWRDGAYEPWIPPKVGATDRLEPSPGVFD